MLTIMIIIDRPIIGEYVVNIARRNATKNNPIVAKNPSNRLFKSFMILPENNELNRLAFELPSSRILEECYPHKEH